MTLVISSITINDESIPRWVGSLSAGFAATTLREQTERADDQAQTADGAEHDGHAGIRVRRDPAKEQVIDRGDRRRREAEREAVERAVMELAAPRRPDPPSRSCSPRRSRADVEG